MTDQHKAEPTQSPPLQPLAAVVRQALDDPAIRKGVRVALRVAGGAPGQSYAFEVRASGDGAGHAELRSQRPERQARAERATVTNEAFVNLLRRLVNSKILETPSTPPRFLPDTLVGYLEVTHDGSVHRAYFAAEPEQARSQGASTSPELSKVVDAVYALGAGLLGRKSVKP